MPPPVESSEEESTGESIPFQAPDQDVSKNDVANNGDAEEEDDSQEDDDVYVVERVLGHLWKRGALYLTVKWKGYENEEDNTDEPEKNLLEDAKDAVNEYYESIGGRPEKGGKKRKSTGSVAETSAKKARKSGGVATSESANGDFESWYPKGKNWEKDVLSVDTIIRDDDNLDKLYGCVTWTNHKKAKVPLRDCYEKLPQKMLQFYEQHLVFKNT